MVQVALTAAPENFSEELEAAAKVLLNTRPTAQNLFYGVGKVFNAARAEGNIQSAIAAAVSAANAVADEDAEACRLIGEHGAALFHQGMRISTTVMQAGRAFVDWGSALSPIYTAHRNGLAPFVYVDETRPRGQGARLTAWELGQEGVAHTVIADNATGYYLAKGKIDISLPGQIALR